MSDHRPDNPKADASAEAPDGGPPADPQAGDDLVFVDERSIAPRECTFSLDVPDQSDERRHAGRFPVERVQCDQGRVRDLSRTGVRLDRRGRLSSDRPVEVMMSDGEQVVTISCDVRWERKLGFMKWEYGLEFRELPEADARSITRIAANCREQRKLMRRPA